MLVVMAVELSILLKDDHPIGMESLKFRPSEMKYSNYGKELSVVVHALKFWKHSLMDSKIFVMMGSKNY